MLDDRQHVLRASEPDRPSLTERSTCDTFRAARLRHSTNPQPGVFREFACHPKVDQMKCHREQFQFAMSELPNSVSCDQGHNCALTRFLKKRVVRLTQFFDNALIRMVLIDTLLRFRFDHQLEEKSGTF